MSGDLRLCSKTQGNPTRPSSVTGQILMGLIAHWLRVGSLAKYKQEPGESGPGSACLGEKRDENSLAGMQ